MDASTDQHETRQQVAGVLAEFGSPDALIAAAAKVREAGYEDFDAHSPFPVHGIDPAVGIRRTPLPWLVLMAGIAGAIIALLMQWWTNAVDYPLIISGKPLFSLPANIPVTFELIVLLSAFAAFFGVFALSGLPLFGHALFSRDRFRRATTDGFFISVDAEDPKFDEAAVSQLLQDAGATVVETYGWPKSKRGGIPRAFFWVGGVAALVALLPPLYVATIKLTKSDKPRMHIVPDMDYQPRYNTQATSQWFADGRTMRLPVEGTVALGELREDDHFYRGKISDEFVKTFPPRFEISDEAMQRGRERFNIYCAACHGYVGEGDGLVSERALARADSTTWIQPLSLHVPRVRQQPVGELFNTITHGIRTMPAYAAQIPPEDRWAIILYVRALQRSQNARIDDVPPTEREQVRARLLQD
jgi:mono/diheme cytochrome c family protein